MDTQTIIILGSQGSGKGTQIRNLISYIEGRDDDKKKILDLQTGKPLRELKEKNRYISELISELIDEGLMIPDVIATAVVVSELSARLVQDSHLFIDGYPRNIYQAKELDGILSFFKRSKISIIYLNTPEDVTKKRMYARGRVDDTEEIVKKRLMWYRKENLPLLEFYKKRKDTNFIEADGSCTIQEVHAVIRKGLSI